MVIFFAILLAILGACCALSIGGLLAAGLAHWVSPDAMTVLWADRMAALAVSLILIACIVALIFWALVFWS